MHSLCPVKEIIFYTFQDITSFDPFLLMHKNMDPTGQMIKDDVKKYYGKTIQNTSDLITSVSCSLEGTKTPTIITEALSAVHEEVTNK